MSAAVSIVPREWMTAAEIAALKLPGLPVTERNVNARADREGWRASSLARQRDGRGGGWEYHHKLLPRSAAAAFETLVKRLADDGKGAALALAAGDELAKERPAVATLTAAQRAVMEARAALLSEVDRVVVTEKRTRSWAVSRVLDQLSHGAEGDPLVAAVQVASERGTVSRAHLFEWLRDRDRFGLLGLAPKPKREKDPLPRWFDDWLRHYAKPTKPCVAEALDAYARTLPNKADAPNYDQVRRALAKLGPLERVQGREGRLAMRKRLAYVSRDTSDLLPSSVYVADGKTFDAEIAHPIHGQPFRPEISSIIDASTRVCVGWSVDLDENAFAVVDALRRACADWGVPAIFYTDRGPGYVAKAMVDPLIGFLGRAHITPMKALPYNSQAKGIVERLNQIYTPFARRFPTYLGSEMDKEARKLAFKVTRSELKATGTSRVLPSWLEFTAGLIETIAAYNDRPHSELPKITIHGRRRHMSPREAWEAKCREGFEPIVPDAAELGEMFRPYMIRTTRRGLVELFTNSYFLLALEAFDGEEVAVGYDQADARQVWVRRIDRTKHGREPGALIGVAVFEGNKTRYVPVSAEKKAMERRVKGQLKRLDDKRPAIEGQLSPLLDYQPAASMPIETPAPAMVPANDAPAAIGTNGRPRFTSKESYVAWLMANPDAFQPRDAVVLRELLKSPTNRDLFRMSGIDVEALRGLARSIA